MLQHIISTLSPTKNVARPTMQLSARRWKILASQLEKLANGARRRYGAECRLRSWQSAWPEPLRKAWFAALYEVLVRREPGPRFGFLRRLVRLVPRLRAMIRRAGGRGLCFAAPSRRIPNFQTGRCGWRWRWGPKPASPACGPGWTMLRPVQDRAGCGARQRAGKCLRRCRIGWLAYRNRARRRRRWRGCWRDGVAQAISPVFDRAIHIAPGNVACITVALALAGFDPDNITTASMPN